MPENVERTSLLFRLVTLAGAVFVFTVFVMIAAAFSPEESPAIRAVNENAGTILLAEVVATAVLSLAAMTVDRIRTLRELQRKNAERLDAARRENAVGRVSNPSLPERHSVSDGLETRPTDAQPADDRRM